ncbi:uncharacterized protein LOC120011170 [Tripterygium wilfordii]|uniref:uncharacterized protein LOC120011170 n=1 Tax=Tripterygium wilfordii TaxID=458696 RepID=UPI0018F7FAF9|nr:uncharacterized protein LOC120011170 [Tripterygium wilfordii]
MIQNYHDAMAICRTRGNPNLFLTFTCNVKWLEIQNALSLIPGQRAEHRPDIVSRVFHMKLDEFMADIKTANYFGRVVGAVYTVEFQKRGLPHVHVIIWLYEGDKNPTIADIDRIICVEIPNKETEPALYDVVSKFMIHGPCSAANPKAPCMKNGRLMSMLNGATDVLQEDVQHLDSPAVDEIKNYVDCRYLTAYESCWRIYEYHIHYKFPAVERLAVHMPLMNNILFPGDKDVATVLQQPGIEKTMLTEWMFKNSTSDDARQLTYAEFPSLWRWDNINKFWFQRKKGQCIGRISYVHPSAGDAYYLCMLLSHVKGPRNFTDIRTVDGIVYDTFKEACNAIGLIADDREWHNAMDEAAQWATSHNLRNLFVTLLLFCEVADANKLFEAQLLNSQEDIVYKVQRRLGITDLRLSAEEIKNQVLVVLQTILQKNAACLSDYKLPMPKGPQLQNLTNTMLREELGYNTDNLKVESENLMMQLNQEQKRVYDSVLSSVYEGNGGFFFVYGHSGTGKTFLYRAIISRLRSEGKIVLAVASLGIASLLLPGGRTAHSRFKIPIEIHEELSCHIKKGTQLAELIKITSLIVWDEAPMAHRNCFEALDRSLNDILANDAEIADNSPSLFGGKTVPLGGDFRQILPVVVKGSRHDTIEACITRSYLWNSCQVFVLKINMRLSTAGLTEEEMSELANFAQWLLDVGEGKVQIVKRNEEEEQPAWIRIPDNMLVHSEKCDIEDITSEVYDGFMTLYQDPNYLKERAIVTGTNDAVDLINSKVLSVLPSDQKLYLSFDSICKVTGGSEENDILYPPEFVNSLSFNGVPNHELRLKINAPVMLLRNLNQSSGLCNGTRLLVTRLGERVVEATIMTGSNIGDKVYIPRIIMSATERKWPFTIKRRQFPLRLCHAMTINKSQGQTLTKVGFAILTKMEHTPLAELQIRQHEFHHMLSCKNVANFIVIVARKNFRVCPSENMLQVGTWTVIKEVFRMASAIPKNRFCFINGNTPYFAHNDFPAFSL